MGRRSRAQPDGDSSSEGRGFRTSLSPDSPRDERFGFALVIALMSTVAALALFFTSTVPAMQEQRFLREVEAERIKLHRDLWTGLEQETRTRAAQQVDVQSLLVELDRRGVFPAELLTPPSAVASDDGRPANGLEAAAFEDPTFEAAERPRSGFPR